MMQLRSCLWLRAWLEISEAFRGLVRPPAMLWPPRRQTHTHTHIADRTTAPTLKQP